MYIERDNVAATAAASAISQSAEFAEWFCQYKIEKNAI